MLTLPVRSLQALAARVVRRYAPHVVGVTGSVGKTSAAGAALAVLLAGGLRAGGAHGNYNNELGLPLTVLGASAPGRNPAAWALVVAKAARLLSVRDPEYPTHLVLEFGADHPGDIAALLRIATPRVAVVTAVAPAHLEFFGTLEAVAAEKATLVEALPDDGVAVLNADDPNVLAMRDRTRARTLTYGFGGTAQVRAAGAHLAMTGSHEPLGVRWHLAYGSDAGEVLTAGTVGRSATSAALAGAAVGVAFGVTFRSILAAVQGFQPPAGRLRLLSGRGGSILVDDSYNSSPNAALEALDAVTELWRSVPRRQRLTVVLGTMAELGRASERLHRAVGAKVAAAAPSRLVTVGAEARWIAEGARAAGYPSEQTAEFGDAQPAGRALASDTHGGDIVLVKGSQAARCERIVAALLANPGDAVRLLVRQGTKWRDRP